MPRMKYRGKFMQEGTCVNCIHERICYKHRAMIEASHIIGEEVTAMFKCYQFKKDK